MSPGRAASTAAIAGAIALTGSCFEPPVSESIEIVFEGPSATTIRTRVRLKAASDLRGRPQERVARASRALAEESDAFAARIREMEPEEDRFELARRRGEIVEAVRTASLESRSAVETLFSGTPVAARYAEGVDWQELSFSADPWGPASAQERRKVDEEIDRWAEEAAAYFTAAADLWEFVERHPERARPCFAALFGRGVSAEADADDEERAKISAVEDRSDAVLGMLAASEEEEFTLSERVRLAYDPFPSEVTVRVPGEVLEFEGFARPSDGTFVVEARDLWNAFRSLEGRWLAPDPAVAMWKHDVAIAKGPFDVDGFAALPRFSAPPPRSSEIVSALRAALKPAPGYRVRWRRPVEGARDGRGSEGTGTAGAIGPSGPSPG